MDRDRVINIAIVCVMSSYLEMKEKTEVIDELRAIEEELIECGESEK